MSQPTPPRRIAILGFGAMGSGIGWSLREAGFEVATCVARRSARTRARAQELGIALKPDLASLVADADTFLSIVPADQAVDLAREAMGAAAGRTCPLHFVDCNSITPSKTERIAEIVVAAGGHFTDAGIIGPPPRAGRNATLFMTSGQHRELFQSFATPEMTFKPLGTGLIEATQMKVLFAAINKGTVALLTNVLAAAERAGLTDRLLAQLEETRPGLIDIATRSAPELAEKSARWAIEMDDLADGLEDLGADGGYHRAAADSYRRLASNIAADGALGGKVPTSLAGIQAAWLRRSAP